MNRNVFVGALLAFIVFGIAFSVVGIYIVVGKTPTTKSGLVTASREPMSSEERIRWEKVRREEGDGRPDDKFTLFISSDRKWLSHQKTTDLEDDMTSAMPRNAISGRVPRCDEKRARQASGELASMSLVNCVAIVDLFGGPDPVVAAWYWNDGHGVKFSRSPPETKYGDELSKHLRKLQKNPHHGTKSAR